VAAPSGGGKTSLVNALLKRDDRVKLSISHTTREPRPGEEDGTHYYFVDEAEFQRLIGERAFLEHARVFSHRYGTGRAAVKQQLKDGYDVLLDIDWQGARQIRETFPACCTIFILPPSLGVLRARLKNRAQDSDEEIQRRMNNARAEISHATEFDHVIINDDFDLALSDLHSIIRTEKPVRAISEATRHSLLAELMGKG
jgi:guanylate kinase